jgi:PRTRC genetic system protein C
MPIERTAVNRQFTYQGQILPDPNPAWSTEKVREHYVKEGYSTLANAAIEGPQHVNGTLLYTFRQAVGAKG